MTSRVAINGFGWIGRAVLRSAIIGKRLPAGDANPV